MTKLVAHNVENDLRFGLSKGGLLKIFAYNVGNKYSRCDMIKTRFGELKEVHGSYHPYGNYEERSEDMVLSTNVISLIHKYEVELAKRDGIIEGLKFNKDC